MLAYCELKRLEKVDDSSDNSNALDDILSIRKEKTDTSFRFFHKKKNKKENKKTILLHVRFENLWTPALHPLTAWHLQFRLKVMENIAKIDFYWLVNTAGSSEFHTKTYSHAKV